MVTAALQLLGAEVKVTGEDGVDEFWEAGEETGCVEATTGIGPTVLVEEVKVLEATHG